MLLGRNGLWMLKSPFTKYATNGLMGEIVAAGFIQSVVSKGNDVKTNVYTPVGGEGLYSSDLAANCIIVHIESEGKIYAIPDKYIDNLYDGQQRFTYHYMTVKVGLLPSSYDLTEAATAMAKGVSEVTGLDVLAKDVYVSVGDKGGMILTDKEGEYENLKRLKSIEDNESIFNQKNKSEDALKELQDKYDTLSDAYSDLLP